MKVACSLVFVAVLLVVARAGEELCALPDEQKETVVKCISQHVSEQMKTKWEALKQTFGSSDLEAVKKLCELKKAEAESDSKSDFFTEEEEAEIKKLFTECKPADKP